MINGIISTNKQMKRKTNNKNIVYVTVFEKIKTSIKSYILKY